jgi:hypothetical protein
MNSRLLAAVRILRRVLSLFAALVLLVLLADSWSPASAPSTSLSMSVSSPPKPA